MGKERPATKAASHTLKIVLHAVTILFIQLGIYAWYQLADFKQVIWQDRYYVWDKIVMLLLVLCCIFPKKTLAPFWCIIGTFFVIRLGLEVSYLSTYFEAINNFITGYRVIFLINLVCTVMVLIIQWKRCPN